MVERAPNVKGESGCWVEPTTPARSEKRGELSDNRLLAGRPKHDQGQERRIICLYSGPAGLPDGVDTVAARDGVIVDMIDVVNGGAEHDVAEDFNFDQIVAGVRAGRYDGALMSPPSSTFIPTLRGELPPDIFGLKKIAGKEKGRVRVGTLHALRCAALARELSSQGKPWGIQTPTPRIGLPSVFKLPQVAGLDDIEGVKTAHFDRRVAGSRFGRPTAIKGTWPYLSGSAAERPRALGPAVLGCGAAPRDGVEDGGGEAKTGAVNLVERTMEYTVKLRGDEPDAKELRKAEDNASKGGLRNAAKVVETMPGHARLGAVLWPLFDGSLEKDGEFERAVLTLVSGKMNDRDIEEAERFIEPKVAAVRARLGRVLGAEVGPAATPSCSTCIRSALLKKWAAVAGDPGAGICDWLVDGAGAGMARDPQGADCIFPAVPKGEQRKGEQPCCNEGAIESNSIDAEAMRQIEDYARRGWLEEVTKEEQEERFGQDYVVSQFVVLTKTKNNKTKRRLILDLKKSGVSARTRHTNRVALPRATDAVHDSLENMTELFDEFEEIECFVIDFRDAFWNVPLHPEERRYFIGVAGGRFFMFLRAAQGSRNGPLAWAGPVSVLFRCTQGLIAGRERARSPRGRGQLYVDDPIVTLAGDKRTRDRIIAVLVVAWCALGFPLAFAKAKRGSDVTWIGCHLLAGRSQVTLSIPSEKIAELKADTLKILKSNVLPTKTLRKYAGLAKYFASILFVWRPFLAELWAGLQSSEGNEKTGAPRNCIWTKQVMPALRWILAFISRHVGTLCVVYRLDAYRNAGDEVKIVGDASVYGYGAFLIKNNVILEYYAEKISEEDEKHLNIAIGDNEHQQTLEALNLLIALRLWASFWRQDRVKLEVRADNVTALTLLLKLKGSTWALNKIAREVAIDMGSAAFRPDVIMHTPGVASSIADALSRKFDPQYDFSFPAALANAKERFPGVRDGRFWATVCQHMAT